MSVSARLDVSTNGINDFFKYVDHFKYVLKPEIPTEKDELIWTLESTTTHYIIKTHKATGDYLVHAYACVPGDQEWDMVLHLCLDIVTIRKVYKNGRSYYAESKLKTYGNIAALIGMFFFLGKLD